MFGKKSQPHTQAIKWCRWYNSILLWLSTSWQTITFDRHWYSAHASNLAPVWLQSLSVVKWAEGAGEAYVGGGRMLVLSFHPGCWLMSVDGGELPLVPCFLFSPLTSDMTLGIQHPDSGLPPALSRVSQAPTKRYWLKHGLDGVYSKAILTLNNCGK